MDETYLTRKDLSENLKVTIRTICAWEKKEILKPIKIGHVIRYRQSDINKILQQTKANG